MHEWEGENEKERQQKRGEQDRRMEGGFEKNERGQNLCFFYFLRIVNVYA